MSPDAPISLLPPPPEGYASRMPWQEEATALESVGLDVFGRVQRLDPEAAGAWLEMVKSSASDGVRLLLVSGFRSVARQREIVERKLARGLDWEEILRVSAYPGYSEHHTGCAVDIGSSACGHLTEAFATTREFQWLEGRAGEFGFSLSYPRDGRSGVAYEPWHWRWRRASGH